MTDHSALIARLNNAALSLNAGSAPLLREAAAEIDRLLAELAKAQQENADAYKRGWDERQVRVLIHRAEIDRLRYVESDLAHARSAGEAFKRLSDASRAEVTSLRTALEALPEQIARKIDEAAIGRSMLVADGIKYAAHVARSFPLSRPESGAGE